MTNKNKKIIRAPIACILGHVDHGKTSLLDKVRRTAVQAREAGGITQHIGASFFPIETIKEIAGDMISKLKIKFTIPGVLIIDTPGHAAFFNLRSRGASVADIAILVVEITSGFKAQTYESLNLLKQRKTPFIIAANKIDKVPGWESHPDKSFLESYSLQTKSAKQALDNLLYEMMGELSSLGLTADRYDRITDYTKTVAIIPTSARTGEGVKDLFLILAGLAQQYMIKKLEYTTNPARGVVLEVKESEGLGTTLDAIIYTGVLKKNDTLVIGSKGEPVVTKIKALLQPKPLDEMRDPRDKFKPVQEIYAAAGVKIVPQNVEDVIAGVPLIVANTPEEINAAKKEIMEELSRFKIETDKTGVIVKADTLGALEAIVHALKEKGIPVRLADVGKITKKDVITASLVADKDETLGVILAFNVDLTEDAKEEIETYDIPVFKSNIIYEIFEAYEEYVIKIKERLKNEELDAMIRPGKIRVLEGYVFRQSKPAIVGIEVIAGRIKPGVRLINEDNQRVGIIQQIQSKKESLKESLKGEQVAISIKGGVVGKYFSENDYLHVDVPEKHVRLLLTKFREVLSEDELEALNDLIKIKRKENKLWAV